MKLKNINPKMKVLLIIVPIFIIAVIFLQFNSRKDAVYDIPSGPTNEDIAFSEYCSVIELLTDSENKYFGMYNYKCSMEKDYQGKIPEGQEATVEIYTADFEEGKTKFREWLKSHNLEESDKLRITYEHKPK